MLFKLRVFSQLLLLAALPFPALASPASTCEPELICGVANVEDMVALPNTPWIIGSGMGDARMEGGGLHLIHQRADVARKVELDLSPGQVAQAPYDQCPGPVAADKFSAHGLSIQENDDNSYNLYVVNHGARQSVEVFRVRPTRRAPTFEWIGCILAPEYSFPNALAARADGSIVMSATAANGRGTLEQTLAGEDTGAVYVWQPDTQWTMVADSALPSNNGIALSEDGKWAFVAAWSDASVAYLPLDPALGEARTIGLDFYPDNIRRTQDGLLAVTGQVATLEEVSMCVANDDRHCAIDYRSVLIDPETLEVTPLYDGVGTEDFGLATVTLQTRHALWMGSARSDCIAKVALRQKLAWPFKAHAPHCRAARER